MQRAEKLAEKKLRSSGLTKSDAKALGIKALSQTQTERLFKHHKLPAMKLAYHDINGRVRNDVYRVRLLADPPPGKFGEKPDKPLRYLQPAGSPPAAYLPKTIPWKDVAKDTSRGIVITEGELKAACAAKHGFACIGLGGVSSWRSKKMGWPLLPELSEIVWKDRDVVILFDSDAQTNPAIMAAAGGLVGELTKRGARPAVAELPDLTGYDKTGLDDYVVSVGPEALREVIDEAQFDDLAAGLWDFNGRFAYLLDLAGIYEDRRRKQYPAHNFATSTYANVWATKISGDGNMRQVSVAKEWIKWPLRRQYAGLTYAPGGEYIIDDKINMWSGWPCEAKKGPVKLWRQLLDHIFEGNNDEEARWWFERWCFYPIAYPGTKLLSAVGMWSYKQGVGKSSVGVVLGRLYGENYVLISQEDLESSFNDWVVNKQFVLVDDVSSHDSRSKADILKKIITQQELLVNQKFQARYSVPDCVNYYLTSNHSNAFFLEDYDRRFFIHEVTSPFLKPEFFNEIKGWLDHGGGKEALRYHAENLDYSGWQPNMPPPMTAAKADMMDAVKSDAQVWLTELRQDPANVLKVGRQRFERDLWTAKELMALYEPHHKGRPMTKSGFTAYLNRYFPKVNGSGVLQTDGKPERYYVVRNDSKWGRATKEQMASHVLKHKKDESGGMAGSKF